MMDYLEIAQLKSKSSASAPTHVNASMSHQGPLPLPVPKQVAHSRLGIQLDTNGQIAPAGIEPRVTTTMWDDEGTRCFQVDAKGICVARREDNNNINATKLLNVTGMTRGRRGGILNSEDIRHVVRLGPMHLRGVWIPFDRALDLANRENITQLLYPLFVYNIEALLYHPVNQTLEFQLYEGRDERAATGPRKGQPLPTPPSSKASTIQSGSCSTVEASLPSTSGTASPEATGSSDFIMSVGYLLKDT